MKTISSAGVKLPGNSALIATAGVPGAGYLLYAIIIFFSFSAMTSLLAQSLTKKQKAQIDFLMSAYDGSTLPSASLAVMMGDKVVYKKSYGMADLEAGKKAASGTNYRLASVSKQFTAAAVIRLIEKKKLSYQTTLTEIFPGFPDYGKAITVHHLLNHTSGLVDYEDLIPDSVTIPVLDADVLRIMTGIDSVYFAPGEKYQYSNTAYALLALAVEKYSGMKYPDYLKKYIFTPSGMKNTLAYVNGYNEVPNRAYGYSIRLDTARRTDQSVTSSVLGDGGIYSNIDDLTAWCTALNNGKLLTRKSWALATTRKQLNDGTPVNYGYGWHLKKWRGMEAVWHSGSTIGFRNVLYRIPEKKLSVIILTNRNSGTNEDSAEKIIAVILEK